MTRTELLETYLKPTDLTVKELINRNAFAQIMQFAEAYSLEQLKAINYNRCCKSDSEQLKTEKEPLPYSEWKKQLNMQKIEDTIFKIGNEYKTINDLLDMYEDYYHSF